MKSIKYSLIGLTLVCAGMSSCQNSFDAPELEVPVATMKPNTTLMELKEMIAENAGSNTNSAFLVPAQNSGDHYIIHGRVISSDASGNIYQSLYIQDETTAINLSIRRASMWGEYRVGQEIVVDATGLYAGLYNGLYQLGWLGTYNNAASMTFMSWDMFLTHSEKNGLPQEVQNITINDAWPSDYPYCITVNSIDEINSFAGGNAQIMGQLVEIPDVSFVDAGIETFAPYQESVNRTIKDSNGGELTVRTSGYSNFYNEILPEGQGTVCGILSYYSGWQLLLRDINDVMFEDMPGYTQETALTVEEAINLENSGRNLWVKGYVVGSVKPGVNQIRSNDDIIFGADAELPNTVVIAPAPNVTDYQSCMVVELRQGTSIRDNVNLVENPERYGQMLYVRGLLNEYLGISGITGANSEYYYEGMEEGPSTPDASSVSFLTDGFGDCTMENVTLPAGSSYIWKWDSNYGYAIASAYVGGSNKESEGYLVTPLVTLSKSPSATFSQALNFLNGNNRADFVNVVVREGTSGTWQNVNVSTWPAGSGWTFSDGCSIDLSAYAGKTIQIGFHYKTTTACAPSWEIKNLVINGVSDSDNGNGGGNGNGNGGGGDTSDDTEYTFLTDGLGDCSLDNITLPEGSTYIWSWDNTYKYAKASAYVGGSNKESEGYLVTPVIKLSSSPNATFSQALNYLSGNNRSDFVNVEVREGTTGEWKTVAVSTWPAGSSWTFSDGCSIDLSAYAGKSIQIGFHYKTTTACAPTWEVKNLVVK